MKNKKEELNILEFLRTTKIIKKTPLAKRLKMKKALLNQYISGDKVPSKKELNKIQKEVVQLGCELMTVENFTN